MRKGGSAYSSEGHERRAGAAPAPERPSLAPDGDEVLVGAGAALFPRQLAPPSRQLNIGLAGHLDGSRGRGLG